MRRSGSQPHEGGSYNMRGHMHNKKGIRRFLRIMNYHHHFIKDYSQIARPFHDLTKDVPFAWSGECEEAFKKLKEALFMGPILALPHDEGKLRLEMDASDMATSVVLSQMQPNGMYRPLGYISKSFLEAEQQYTTYDKELLGIMQALEDWRNLLISAWEPFEILTNHRNLTYFCDLQKLTGHQVNWTTKLQDFDFIIRHISGESNRRVDALSRLEDAEKVSAKVGMVLPDQLFVHNLSGKKGTDDNDTERQEWGRDIASFHDLLTVGHPGIKCTLDLLLWRERSGREYGRMSRTMSRDVWSAKRWSWLVACSLIPWTLCL
jgi:hypothetical protein